MNPSPSVEPSPAESHPVKPPQSVCPECGALQMQPASKCWLCFAPLAQEQPVVTAEFADTPLPPPPPPAQPPAYMRFTEPFFAICTLGSLLLLALVGIGIATDEPGALIGYLILVLPPLIGCLLYWLGKRSTGKPLTWAGRFVSLVVSGAVMVGVLSLISVALIVGLFLFFISMVASGNL